jgi:serine-type D-Ala-D-Ala carboxypeptidase/endopeptidase
MAASDDSKAMYNPVPRQNSMKKTVLKLLVVFVLIPTSCNAQTPSVTHTITPSAAAMVIPLNTSTIHPSVTALSTATQTLTPTATPGIVLFDDDQLRSRIDQLAESFLEKAHNPGLSVAVIVRDPQTGQLESLLLNYGKIARGSNQPVNSKTVYEIGSITKVFTGILLAEKVNDGTVTLDEPIQKFMPENIQAPQYKDKPITLVDLATHRSGLPRDLYSDDPTALYQWLNSFKPAHAPGEQYVYSNLGYMLLGSILSGLSQSDFGSLEFTSVSQPLGLMDTRLVLTSDEIEHQAQGYGFDGSQARYFPDSGAMSSAGYLHSTLQDMTRFLLANMEPDSTPLGSSIKLAQTMHAEGRNPGSGTGLGWEIENPGTPQERISKGGGTPGFTSYISFTADGNSGFVLLTNGQLVNNLVADMTRLSIKYP